MVQLLCVLSFSFSNLSPCLFFLGSPGPHSSQLDFSHPHLLCDNSVVSQFGINKIHLFSSWIGEHTEISWAPFQISVCPDMQPTPVILKCVLCVPGINGALSHTNQWRANQIKPNRSIKGWNNFSVSPSWRRTTRLICLHWQSQCF